MKSTGPIKTLAANVAETQALKKKENPYLLHTKAVADIVEEVSFIKFTLFLSPFPTRTLPHPLKSFRK